MAKMSTTAKVLTGAAVVTGVYLVARSVKAQKKIETKKTNGALPPDNGTVGTGGKGTGTGTGNGGAKLPAAPPFPEENVAQEDFWIDEIFTPWAAQYAEEDAAAIQAGEVDAMELAADLTDDAFESTYPSWENSQFPSNWAQSPEWTKWANAWNRMNQKMVDLVSATLAEYGV